MKKFLAVILAALITTAFFVGCSPKEKEDGESVKTGLAIVTTINKSKNAENGTGVAEANSTVVAVTVDNDGKIVKCAIDTAQTKVNFSDEGRITTPLNTVFKTKNELKEDYNMKGNSGIGKEWYEQAAAFAEYVTGKTVDDIEGIAVDEGQRPTEADLKSTVTIAIGDFIEGVKKAVNNAKTMGAKGSDKLGLGIVTSIAKSNDAGDDDGLAQIYSTYAAVTTDADGKITSCALDASQSQVNFDRSGVITTDININPKTKNERGDEYGMRGASGIGKEWYEQANAFAEYVVGKSANEVEGIAVNDGGYPTENDLKSSVTVTIGDFKDVIKKASQNAK
ncbi:MAG: hypothetical protein PHX02_03250 [Oscillospiraceae bacterium]|nr:hypothetical protein [Oscillospiraceae bacterium]